MFYRQTDMGKLQTVTVNSTDRQTDTGKLQTVTVGCTDRQTDMSQIELTLIISLKSHRMNTYRVVYWMWLGCYKDVRGITYYIFLFAS